MGLELTTLDQEQARHPKNNLAYFPYSLAATTTVCVLRKAFFSYSRETTVLSLFPWSRRALRHLGGHFS